MAVARKGLRGKKAEGKLMGLGMMQKMTSLSGLQTVNYPNDPFEPTQMFHGRTLESNPVLRSALKSKVTAPKGLIRPNIMDDGHCRQLLCLIELDR